MIDVIRKLRSMLLAAFLLAGCCTVEPAKIVQYRQLTALPAVEMEKRVSALPPKQQVDLYVMALAYFKPGDTKLAPVLARQGAKILPPLVEQLEKTDSGMETQALVMVLYQMLVIHRLEEAKQYAPRVANWCDRQSTKPTYCHEMGRAMLAVD